MTECPRKRAILGKVDGGLFSATWWPYARIDRADILSCVALWLFIWDDGDFHNSSSHPWPKKTATYVVSEIDNEVGSLSCDFEAAQAFRLETITWAKYCLGLSASTEEVPKLPSNQIIAFFKTIADASLEAYDLGHRQILFSELQRFVEATELEQAQRLSPSLPTVEEYAANRMQTSAVNIMCFFVEYGCDIVLPVEVLTDPDMRAIWSSTNRIVHNDLLSLKKEVAQSTVDSMVPLLFYELGSLDQAVEAVMGIAERAAANLEASEEALLARHAHDAALHRDLKAYVAGCKSICTGNLVWSLRTKRYGIGNDVEDGSLSTYL
ncbi:hypothetical protein ACJZ2D_004907 [Fusarium nematophilum]